MDVPPTLKLKGAKLICGLPGSHTAKAEDRYGREGSGKGPWCPVKAQWWVARGTHGHGVPVPECSS